MFCEEAGLDGDEFGGALRGRVAPRAVEDPERPERSAQGLVVAVSTRSAGRWPSRRRAQHRRPRSTRIRSARQCAGRHPLSFWHVRSAADMMAGCVRGRKSRTPRWRSRDCSCFVRAALCVWSVAGRSPVPAFGAIRRRRRSSQLGRASGAKALVEIRVQVGAAMVVALSVRLRGAFNVEERFEHVSYVPPLVGPDA